MCMIDTRLRDERSMECIRKDISIISMQCTRKDRTCNLLQASLDILFDLLELVHFSGVHIIPNNDCNMDSLKSVLVSGGRT